MSRRKYSDCNLPDTFLFHIFLPKHFPFLPIFHPLSWSPPAPCIMAVRTILRQTAQPRRALTLPSTKCKLYSRAVQTCQLGGFSCSGNVIGMKIRCFGVPGTCLNICCDFPLDIPPVRSTSPGLIWKALPCLACLHLSSWAVNHSHICLEHCLCQPPV